MDETIRAAAISPLRQRLIDDMNMRRFSRATQHGDIRDAGRFATFLSQRMTRAASRSSSARPACRVSWLRHLCGEECAVSDFSAPEGAFAFAEKAGTSLPRRAHSTHRTEDRLWPT